MPDYVLSCESTADIPASTLEEYSLEYIPFHFYLDGTEYPDDLGKTVPYDEFYRRMVEGEETRTAAISTGEYREFFRSFLREGRDVLHVSLSSGLSATADSARQAAESLAAEFPERTVRVIDSLAASGGFGLFMITLSEKRASGMTLSDLADWAEANKLKCHHEFFSTDLTFYIKGGRVKPVTGYVGNLLNICPLLDVDREGHLIPREKIRSKKKVIRRIVEKMAGYADDGENYRGKVVISHSNCPEDAAEVARLVTERFGHMDGEPLVTSIGTTIGSHTGPGTVALFFWGAPRV